MTNDIAVMEDKEQDDIKVADKPVRRMSKDLRRSKVQRERILRAVSEIVARDTTGKIKLQDIATQLGCSKGIIYYYFKSKGELLYHMHTYAQDLVDDVVIPVLTDTSLPPRVRLERTIRAYAEVICANWQIWRCFWWDVNLRETPRDLSRIVQLRGLGHHKMLAELVDEVCEAEGWSCTSSETTARMMTDLVQSVSRWYVKGGRVSAEELTNRIVKCCMEGFFDKP